MNLQDKSSIPIFSGKWTFQLSWIKNPFKTTFPFLPFQNPCIKLGEDFSNNQDKKYWMKWCLINEMVGFIDVYLVL